MISPRSQAICVSDCSWRLKLIICIRATRPGSSEDCQAISRAPSLPQNRYVLASYSEPYVSSEHNSFTWKVFRELNSHSNRITLTVTLLSVKEPASHSSTNLGRPLSRIRPVLLKHAMWNGALCGYVGGGASRLLPTRSRVRRLERREALSLVALGRRRDSSAWKFHALSSLRDLLLLHHRHWHSYIKSGACGSDIHISPIRSILWRLKACRRPPPPPPLCGYYSGRTAFTHAYLKSQNPNARSIFIAFGRHRTASWHGYKVGGAPERPRPGECWSDFERRHKLSRKVVCTFRLMLIA